MSATDVDSYVATFPKEVADRLVSVRTAILKQVPGAEEKLRYGIAAVMLGERYALHFAGWKKHIGLYPVPVLSAELEPLVAPYRSGKDSVNFPHHADLPLALISSIASEIVALRSSQ